MSDNTNYFVINTEAAIYREGKWLVGIRSKNESEAAGMISFVGGTVEHFDPKIDTLEGAVAREVEEEIGLKVKAIDFINDTSFVSKKGNHVVNIVFLCEVVDGESVVSDTNEMESLQWLTTEELLNYPNAPVWICDSIKKADSLVKIRS